MIWHHIEPQNIHHIEHCDFSHSFLYKWQVPKKCFVHFSVVNDLSTRVKLIKTPVWGGGCVEMLFQRTIKNIKDTRDWQDWGPDLALWYPLASSILLCPLFSCWATFLSPKGAALSSLLSGVVFESVPMVMSAAFPGWRVVCHWEWGGPLIWEATSRLMNSEVLYLWKVYLQEAFWGRLSGALYSALWKNVLRK